MRTPGMIDEYSMYFINFAFTTQPNVPKAYEELVSKAQDML